MKKTNYQKELEKILAEISPEQKKQTLLLHACCGPCSSYVIEYLAKFFDITIFFYNPNIHPKTEYDRRLNELKKFLGEFPEALKNKVKLIIENYDTQGYFDAVKTLEQPELQTEREKGERCRRCYEFRMKKAFLYACENKFDWFTTTLSISPHKDSEKINKIGQQLENSIINENIENALIKTVKFLPSDFKKNGGFLRSTELSKEFGLWRQDYCGCVYSKSMREKKSTEDAATTDASKGE